MQAPGGGSLESSRCAAAPTIDLTYGALALLVAALWFATLSLRPLFNTDEGRYAEIPREMLASGDWVDPASQRARCTSRSRRCSIGRRAASLAVFGQQRVCGARLYTALCALGAVLAARARGARAVGAGGSACGRAALLSSMLLFLAHGPAAHPGHEPDGLYDGRARGVPGRAVRRHHGGAAPHARSPGRRRRWACSPRGSVAAAIPAARARALQRSAPRDFSPWRQLHAAGGLRAVSRDRRSLVRGSRRTGCRAFSSFSSFTSTSRAI